LAREIVRQGEARLEAIMALTIAAVTRATTLCGVFGAGSIALVAAVLAYLGTEHPIARLLIAGSVTASLLLVASVLAAFAGTSRKYWGAGAIPSELRNWSWSTCGAGTRWSTEEELLDAVGERLDKAIDKNLRLIRREGFLVNLSLWVALAAVIAGPVAYWVPVPTF
jgi:hypothetical protein